MWLLLLLLLIKKLRPLSWRFLDTGFLPIVSVLLKATNSGRSEGAALWTAISSNFRGFFPKIKKVFWAAKPPRKYPGSAHVCFCAFCAAKWLVSKGNLELQSRLPCNSKLKKIYLYGGPYSILLICSQPGQIHRD